MRNMQIQEIKPGKKFKTKKKHKEEKEETEQYHRNRQNQSTPHSSGRAQGTIKNWKSRILNMVKRTLVQGAFGADPGTGCAPGSVS